MAVGPDSRVVRSTLQPLVAPQSDLARYAQWQGLRRPYPVGLFGTTRNDALLFIEDEVLVDGRDKSLIDELSRRYDGELLPEAPLPEPPGDWPKRRQLDLQSLPQTRRIRLRRIPERVATQPIPVRGRLSDARRAQLELQDAKPLIASSERAAALMAVVGRHVEDGARIGLHRIGQTFVMPLTTAQEGAGLVYGANPFQWNAFAGRTQMVRAWQLIDSVRRVAGDRFVTVGILDGGFWLDGTGAPNVAPGQPASDFGAGVMQLNLQAEGTPAGGPNPSQCSGGSSCPWHGNAVASAACAALNDGAGATGSSGSAGRPFLFRTDLSEAQVLRCVRMCAAWGIDVLNMSFGIPVSDWDLTFGSDDWEDTFRFAADNGVILIAAAGNNQTELPDGDGAAIRPATRTPGVLTVGALDQTDNAWTSPSSGSNYGSSVGLWAPGVNVPVAPDGNSPQGRFSTGTSLAAPIVSGVAAMMRYVNEGISAHDVRQLLVQSGWQGNGRVSRGLDAYAAVLAALQAGLPDNGEPNNTPATARELIPVGPGGALAPAIGVFSSRSKAHDTNFWRFKVASLSTVSIELDWYERLSRLAIDVEAIEDEDARGPAELVSTGDAGSGRTVLTGMLSPGEYRLRLTGNAATAYRLLVRLSPAGVSRDAFEANDSFDSASVMVFDRPSGPWVAKRRGWGPGTFDLTIHRSLFTSVFGGPRLPNDDHFLLDAPKRNGLLEPVVSIFDTDQPLEVVLYDVARVPIQTWSGVRNLRLKPPPGVASYLKVSASEPTRYRLSVMMQVDPRVVPGPLQEKPVFKLPDWWLQPTVVTRDLVTHFAWTLEPTQDGEIGQEGIAFARSEPGLRLELLDAKGRLVRRAEVESERVLLNTAGLEPGQYFVSVVRNPSTVRTRTATLSQVPPLA